MEDIEQGRFILIDIVVFQINWYKMNQAIVSIWASFMIVSSCSNGIDSTGSQHYERTYIAYSPVKAKLRNAKQQLIMHVTAHDGLCIVRREFGILSQEVNADNPLYLQGLARMSSSSMVEPFNQSGPLPVWFVPFNPGKPVVNLSNGNKCIKYICSCGGFPGTATADCCVQDDGSIIRCDNCPGQSCPNDVQCLGWAVIIDCASRSPEDYASGGVFVAARDIQLQDPPGYDVNNQGLIFRVDSFH